MNYLAHLFLAQKNEGLILGALWEDYIYGGLENEKNKNLPSEVKLGLKLHRHIDFFTDSDLDLKVCKEIFYPQFGKYSPVILDVVFDHYLHRNWAFFSDESFNVFKERTYSVLSSSYLELQPLGMKKLVESMLEHDWLKNYIYLWGVEKALSSLNRRAKNIDLTQAVSLIETNDALLNSVFLSFFERLQASCQEFLQDHGQ